MIGQVLPNSIRELPQPKACSLMLLATLALAQVSAYAVTDVTTFPLTSVSTTKHSTSEVLDSVALEKLIASIALYPDDIIAIVLPASTDPVGVVLAARNVQEEQDHSGRTETKLNIKSGQLDANQAIEALKHYPDVLAKMNADLNWTQALGEAASSQQGDLLKAIQQYRKAAADSGILRNDDHQVVYVADNTVMIRPRDSQVIYVPEYSPRQVVIHRTSSRRTMSYHTTPSPVYYRRYNASHRFYRATQNWHGPTFTLSWRNGQVQRRDYRHITNRHYRPGQRHYLHNDSPQSIKPASTNHNRRHDNRQQGYIDHNPRNKYHTHQKNEKNRRYHSSRHNQKYSRKRNSGYNNEHDDEIFHNRRQQRYNSHGSKQINGGDQRNSSRTSIAPEQTKQRAWKG